MDSAQVVEQVSEHKADIGFTGTVLAKKALQIYSVFTGMRW